jgi:hypothetical protein
MPFPPTVSRFCCCCSLKAGAYIIGSIYIISGVLLVLAGSLTSNIISEIDDKFDEKTCEGLDKDTCRDLVILIFTGVIQILLGEPPEPLLIKPCSLSGLLGVVGTFKNNSCLVGTFAIIYAFGSIVSAIGSLVFAISLISGQVPFTVIKALNVPDDVLTTYSIFSLAGAALACYWSVCLYSLWKEVADRSAAMKPALGGTEV